MAVDSLLSSPRAKIAADALIRPARKPRHTINFINFPSETSLQRRKLAGSAVSQAA
jgi:hypothetical protein